MKSLNRILWVVLGIGLSLTAYGIWLHDMDNFTAPFGLVTVAALTFALLTDE